MNNENSQQFLINKKIAQLVKLISHIDTLNIEREHNIFFLTKKIDELFNQSYANYYQIMENTYRKYKSTDEKANQIIKTEYESHLQQLEFDFSNNITKLRENINEAVSLFENTTSEISETIMSITDKIDIFFQNTAFNNNQQINNIKIQVQQLNEQYQKEISQINSELNSKMKNFESTQNLSELDQNFSYSDFNQNRSLNDVKSEIIQLKTSIKEIKQKFLFFFDKTQKTFYQQTQEFKNIINNDENNSLDRDSKSTKSLFELELFELKSYLNSFIENKILINEKEKKKHTESIIKMTSELKKFIEEKELKKSNYSVILKNHKNELDFLKNNFLTIENEFKNRIKSIKQNNLKISDNKIDYQQFIDDLLIEKENLLNFKKTIELFERENNELTEKLNKDLINAKKQEKLMINAVLDTHRNEIFVKNNEIARIYDIEIEQIRIENQKNDIENEINSFYKKKFKEFQIKLNEYNDKKNHPSLSVNDNVDDIQKLNKRIEKLNEIKKSKIEFIESIRNEINESFIKQEKNEILRHQKLMNEYQNFSFDYSNKLKIEFEKIKNFFNSSSEKLDNSIKHFQILLENEKRKNSLNEKEINEAFDQDEKELKTVFHKTKFDFENEIEKINKIHENKKESINHQIIEINEKINNLKKSFISESSEKSNLIEKSKIESNKKFTEIQENLTEQEIFIMRSNSDKLCNIQNSHSEKLNTLFDQISIQKEKNKSEKLKNEEQIKKNQLQFDHQLELLKSSLFDKINDQKIKHEKEIKELDKTIDEINKKNSLLKNSFEKNDIRNEDQITIEKLENELSMLEQHLKDISLDLTNYKKKIVSQEVSYNSQFGKTPTVAVLRPKTGFGQMNIRGSLRLNTTVGLNRTKSLMKNQSNKSAIHF